MIRKTTMARTLAAVALAAALVGCGPKAPRDQRLTVVGQGWPISLIPHGMPEIFTVMVQSNLYEGLVEFDSRMKVVPLLAENWETPDPLTWVFKLRRGIAFHDGSPFTADDVVFSLRRAKEDPGSSLRANFVQVDTIAKVDDYTVRITTRRPFPLLLYKLVSVFIVPRGAFTNLGPARFGQSPVGTGPYRLKSYPAEGPLVLEAFPEYWRSLPQFGEMQFIAPTMSGEVQRLLAGGRPVIIPMLDQAIARQMDTSKARGYRIHHRSGLVLRYLGFRYQSKPFNNPLVRQALTLAVDRGALVDAICFGYGTPANQPVPATVFGFNDRLPPLAYDTVRARRLLKQAGFPQGLELSLTVPEQREAVARALQEQMRPAGIRLNMILLSRERFFAALDTASFFYIGYGSTSGDASDLLDEALHSRSGGYGVNNYGRYANPEVDRMIEVSDTSFSQERRLRLIQRAMELAYQDAAMVPLYVEDQVSGASAGLRWTPRLDMMVLGKEVGLLDK